MKISAICEHCSARFQVSDTAAGKRVRCKSCGEPTRVSSAGGRPRGGRGRRKRKSAGMPAWGWAVVVLLVIGGGVGAVLTLGGGRLPGMTPRGYEGILTRSIAIKQEAVEILQGVSDAASAEKAVPRIQALQQRAAELNDEFNALVEQQAIPAEEWLAADRELNGRVDSATARLNDTWSALRQNREAADVLSESMNELGVRFNQLTAARLEHRPKPPPATGGDLYGGAASARSEGTAAAAVGAQEFLSRDEQRLANILAHNPTRTPPEQRAVIKVNSENQEWLKDVHERVAEITGRKQHRAISALLVGPVNDLDELARCIDFGRVVSVDHARRRIEVEPDESWTYTVNAGPRLAGIAPRTDVPSRPAAAPRPQEQSVVAGDGPHGGRMLTLGPGMLAEFLLYPRSEYSEVYLYDDSGRTPRSIAAEQIYVNFRLPAVGEISRSMRARPIEGDPEGHSSHFIGPAYEVHEALRNGGSPYIHFQSEGTRYRAPL